jgi:hypothetical protein
MFLALHLTLLELASRVAAEKREVELRTRYNNYFLNENLVTKAAGVFTEVSKGLAIYKRVEQGINSL